MDLHLSREQEMLRKMYRDFAENEVKPLAEWVDENEAFPEETVKKMAKLGMMGIYFPKEYGGAGADVLSYVMAVEALSSPPTPPCAALPSMRTAPRSRRSITCPSCAPASGSARSA